MSDGPAVSLSTRSLQVVSGGRMILDGVELTASAGQVLGLVGPNGAGKTTLVRSLAGLVRPAAGVVMLSGQDVNTIRPKRVARLVAYVPQDTTVTFPFTVREVVFMGRHPHLGRFATERESDHDIVEDALRAMGIAHLADRIVPTLSGGERQLVILAKALAQQPRCLLMDEPMAALDLRHQLDVLHFTRVCATQGRTVVVALHDLNQAARFCDQLALLSQGRLIGSGAPKEVVTVENLAATYGVRAAVRNDDLTGSLNVTALGPVRKMPVEGAS